jgi:hypothetical protein
MNRIGLKIACLAAAIVIWIQVASTTVSEADLRMPIVVVNLPAGLALSGVKVPQEAVVRVRAAKLRVIAHKYLHRPLGRVEIDLANRQSGATFLYEITPADVRTEQEVVAVLPPARLPLRLDRQDQRRMPVEVEVVGHAPAGTVLLAPAVARPGDTAVRVVDDVPVTAVGVGGRSVAVSPSLCDVTIEGPADSVRAMRVSDLRVVVDATGERRDMPQVPARVEHPAWVTRATVVPETFVLLAGEGRTE